MPVELLESIADRTSTQGMTPEALAILEGARAAAEQAGLARIVITAGRGGGHLSHSQGTEWDIKGYNADGSLWTTAQRVTVAEGARQTGADRFGIYNMAGGRGGGSLHIGLSGPGRPAAVWGANGRVRGEQSRAFTDDAEVAFLNAYKNSEPLAPIFSPTMQAAAGPAPVAPVAMSWRGGVDPPWISAPPAMAPGTGGPSAYGLMGAPSGLNTKGEMAERFADSFPPNAATAPQSGSAPPGLLNQLGQPTGYQPVSAAARVANVNGQPMTDAQAQRLADTGRAYMTWQNFQNTGGPRGIPYSGLPPSAVTQGRPGGGLGPLYEAAASGAYSGRPFGDMSVQPGEPSAAMRADAPAPSLGLAASRDWSAPPSLGLAASRDWSAPPSLGLANSRDWTVQPVPLPVPVGKPPMTAMNSGPDLGDLMAALEPPAPKSFYERNAQNIADYIRGMQRPAEQVVARPIVDRQTAQPASGPSGPPQPPAPPPMPPWVGQFFMGTPSRAVGPGPGAMPPGVAPLNVFRGMATPQLGPIGKAIAAMSVANWATNPNTIAGKGLGWVSGLLGRPPPQPAQGPGVLGTIIGQPPSVPVAAYQNSGGQTFAWNTGPATTGAYAGAPGNEWGQANNVPFGPSGLFGR